MEEKNRREIIHLLYQGSKNTEEIKEILDLSPQMITRHCKILAQIGIIAKSRGKNSDDREVFEYHLCLVKLRELLYEIPEIILHESSPDERRKKLKEIIDLPEEEETKLISIEFMEKISQNGKMDICVPSHSVQFIVECPEYIEGYRKMKSRGIKIRVITEITAENVKFCINMIENNMIDEIRHLTGVTCGIAVSENQYMTAFLSAQLIKIIILI